jgi:hypothetical protein
LVETIQQYFKSVEDARKKLSSQMKDQFSSISRDYPGYLWKIKSIKLSSDSEAHFHKLKIYDITFEKRKRPNLKGHPFRSRD